MSNYLKDVIDGKITLIDALKLERKRLEEEKQKLKT